MKRSAEGRVLALPQHGKVIDISEISCLSNIGYQYEKSIRVTGRMSQHDCAAGQATLTDPHTNSHVCIDTRLVEPLDGRIGSLFQVIGECHTEQNICIIKARIMLCVDGIDLKEYKRALEIQRSYLSSRNANHLATNVTNREMN